jgi:hypothetical protein
MNIQLHKKHQGCYFAMDETICRFPRLSGMGRRLWRIYMFLSRQREIRYIINQQEHHKKECTDKECERICKENGIVPELQQLQVFNPLG